MANFDYKAFLKEGGIEKYLLEENFGNDIESRFQYIRPLMDRLPDTARTEAMLDGMVDARTEDDKMAFDFYFVETMKMLGLEDELIEDQDLEDYYDEYRFYKRQGNLDENDTYLDELLQMPDEEEEEGADIEVLDDVEELEIEKDITININLEEGKFEVGDMVVMRTDTLKGAPMKVVGMRKKFASPLQVGADVSPRASYNAISVETQTGDTEEYDEIDLVKLKEGKYNVGDEVILRGGSTITDVLKVVDMRKMFDSDLMAYTVEFPDGSVAEYDETQLSLNPFSSLEELEGEVQTENKLLKASNTLEDMLNDVVDDLTDGQIDKFTEMILDLRDKVRATIEYAEFKKK